MASDKTSGKSTEGTKSTTNVLLAFQMLRNEQRAVANKLSELEMELNEHKIVIDTLKNVDAERKCYRMTGCVLRECTVKEVIPELILNKDFLTDVIDNLNDQLTEKGIEINEFKEKHNIKVMGQQDVQQPQQNEGSNEAKSSVVVNSLLNNYT
ncbi:prefoldin 2 [Nomia melanderi]|uniref:prefoldin 2 n=1 Tax=Nomia melanderi TaxID=2448451 RepID=UPI00130407E1|nr:prefoldin subunit 2 [Nomia melanderi]